MENSSRYCAFFFFSLGISRVDVFTFSPTLASTRTTTTTHTLSMCVCVYDYLACISDAMIDIVSAASWLFMPPVGLHAAEVHMAVERVAGHPPPRLARRCAIHRPRRGSRPTDRRVPSWRTPLLMSIVLNSKRDGYREPDSTDVTQGGLSNSTPISDLPSNQSRDHSDPSAGKANPMGPVPFPRLSCRLLPARQLVYQGWDHCAALADSLP